MGLTDRHHATAMEVLIWVDMQVPGPHGSTGIGHSAGLLSADCRVAMDIVQGCTYSLTPYQIQALDMTVNEEWHMFAWQQICQGRVEA